VEQPPFQRRAVANPDVDRGVHLFPDARHAEKDARRHFGEVLAHRFDRLAEMHHGTGGQRNELRKNLLRHMAERQVGEQAVVLGGLENLAVDGRQPQHVAVGEDHTLGLGRGARGVDQRAPAVGIQGAEPVLDLCGLQCRGRLATAGDEGLPGAESRIGVQVEAARLDDDDAPQMGQRLRRGQQLVRLLLVLDHRHRRPAMVEHVGHIRRRMRGVNPGRQQAQGLGAQIGKQPFRAVVGEDGNTVAGLQALGPQRLGDAHHLVQVGLPGERPPEPAPFFAQGDPLGPVVGEHRHPPRQGVADALAEGAVEWMRIHRSRPWEGTGASSRSSRLRFSRGSGFSLT
jgi:hypothetical protein